MNRFLKIPCAKDPVRDCSRNAQSIPSLTPQMQLLRDPPWFCPHSQAIACWSWVMASLRSIRTRVSAWILQNKLLVKRGSEGSLCANCQINKFFCAPESACQLSLRYCPLSRAMIRWKLKNASLGWPLDSYRTNGANIWWWPETCCHAVANFFVLYF